MTDLVGRVLGIWFDASLAATVIAGLVVLVMVQCRQPARRLGWARAGLLATLTLPPLAALNPVPPIDVGLLFRMIVPSRWDDPGQIRARAGPSDAYLPDLDACPPPGGGLPSGVAGRGWLRPLAKGLVLAYAAGAAIGLGWLALGLWGLAILARRGHPPSAETLALYGTLPFSSFRARPRLLISDRLTRPALMGLLRPTILLPLGSEVPGSGRALRLSLLHELAHAESGDHLIAPAIGLVQAIWFFLPPIWWIRDQMKMDQEFLADCRAVSHFGNSGGYASSLVDLAASIQSQQSVREASPLAEALPSVASALFQRVVMLLKCPFAIENRPPLWWRRSAAATITIATLAASCLSFRGLALAPRPEEASVIKPARSFRIPDLVITPSGGGDQPFDLRFRLPASFTLNLEIMADPNELPDLEILNHPLGSSRSGDPTRQVYRLWHRVTVRRDEGHDHLEVDGQPLEVRTDGRKLATWLAIKPQAGRPTRIRDLDLAW